MRIIRQLCLILVYTVLLSACGNEIPEPETKLVVEPLHIFEGGEDGRSVQAANMETAPQFFVRHQVKGMNVYVECIIPGVSFRADSGKNRAKIGLFVDGRKQKDITSAAFIIKNLPAGTHTIQLNVLKNDNTSYHEELKKEFTVRIQS
ncbi:hypothetical protein ACQCT6_06885 [Cytobacillus gottheilii]|uniref:Lipoprotein n=1 Tax=Cytobacillus gottheilii TaxID=859144 RepID=A0ABX8FGN3_9BACI|nr:hypothetical protein [Cytobacillus gottheilii]QVY63164.1 hypothetical protein J1899_09020 [Cytobacillus gottheilii]